MDLFSETDMWINLGLGDESNNNAENDNLESLLNPTSEMETVIMDMDIDPDVLEANIQDNIFFNWDQKAILEENNPENSSSSSITSVNQLLEFSEELPPPVQGRGKTKRGVGRPPRTDPPAVTVLPVGKVSKKRMEEARYRRMRDLNNIASQKCRLRR